MLNQKMKSSRRILLVVILAAALAYHLFAGQVNQGALLAREKAFVKSVVDAVLSSSAVTSVRKTYKHAEVLITGSSVAAKATAEDDAKGVPAR
ncbi:MAG: hypothetical protein K8R48_04785 [Alphaproteobacteria bacterium]|nr:hypothetical protein [Alphaproteobacteria bacterium]